MAFLQDYLKFNEGNEVPKIYTLWSALASLSVAVGHRVYKDWEQYRIYANIYVLLIGESGNRKTSARDIAKEILREALPDTIVSASCESRQGMIKFMDGAAQLRKYTTKKGELVEYRPMAIFCGEFANYVSVDPAGMITFLTDIYDGKVYDYRLKNEVQYLVNPYLVLLGCAVPDWLTNKIKLSEFCAGFGRRAIFVCDDSDIRIPHPYITQEGKDARKRCVDVLTKMQDVVGEASFEPKAGKLWDQWYRSIKLPSDKFLRAWKRSVHVIAQKLAMLIAVSETLDTIIHLNHLEYAIFLLDEVEKGFPMVTALMGRGELSEPAQNILRFIRDRGGIVLDVELKREFVLKEFKSPVEYFQVITHLKQTEQIIETKVRKDNVVRVVLSLPGIVTEGEKK